jgi:hypothetical protein
MHGASGVIDRMHNKIFEQLRKVKIICQTAVTPHARLHAGVIDTAGAVHAGSLTPHVKYDTACTIEDGPGSL